MVHFAPGIELTPRLSFWLFLLGAAIWQVLSIWMAKRYHRVAPDRPWLLWPIEITVTTALMTFMGLLAFNEGPFSAGIGAIIAALLPIATVALVLVADPFFEFAWYVLVPFAAAGFVIAATSRRLKAIAPIAAFLFALLAVVGFGNRHWDKRICQSAAELGLSDIRREPFLTSLTFRTEERGGRAYATAQKGEKQWHWSYFQTGFHISRTQMTLPPAATELKCDA